MKFPFSLEFWQLTVSPLVLEKILFLDFPQYNNDGDDETDNEYDDDDDNDDDDADDK